MEDGRGFVVCSRSSVFRNPPTDLRPQSDSIPAMCNYWDKFPELQWLCQFEDAPGNQDGAYFKPHTQTPCFVRAPTIFQPRTPSMTIAFCMSTGLSLSLYQSLCTGPVCLAWTPSIATSHGRDAARRITRPVGDWYILGLAMIRLHCASLIHHRATWPSVVALSPPSP